MRKLHLIMQKRTLVSFDWALKKLQLSQLQKETFLISQVYEIYPEYYVIKINNFNDIAKDTLDEWIYFFKNTTLPEKYSAKGLKLIEKALNINNLPEKERHDYETHQKDMQVEKNVMNTAKLEGRAEGRAEGERLAIEKVACQMLKKGLPVDTISELTGLTLEEIQNLPCIG